MPYPEAFKLAPGMKKNIPISFRPAKYEPHVDRVQILTKGGSFFVIVKAMVKDIAFSVPQFLDFALCPTMEKSEQTIEVFNTGSLKAALRWRSKPPFSVKCPTDMVEVGHGVKCVVSFEPRAASVFDGVLVCEAVPTAAASVTMLADEEDDASPKERREVKRYFLQCTGVGKMPHLCVPNGRSANVEFGSVLPGARALQTLEILNTTPVQATFQVRPLLGNGEISPLPPAPFTVSPESGVVDPSCPFTLTFYFQSQTVKEHACQRFQITTPGGTPLVVTCTAFCAPIQVRLSSQSVNFGEVLCGKMYSRTLQIHNESSRPASYHFVNADHLHGVFWLDRHMGVVPPNSFMVVTLFFGPMAPNNYHKQVSCIVKGAAAPLSLSLLGSAYNDKQRPARLDQRHIDIFRNMQLAGIREFPPPPERSEEQDDAEDETLEDEAALRSQEVATKPLSATASFLELMLPTDSKLRDIAVSPGVLDFRSCSALTLSEKHTVTVTNRTSQKVTVSWMIPGETRLPCSPEDKGLFMVYPTTQDIKPRGTADFTVAFKPQRNGTFEGATLEAVVSQKINRSFRLVDTQRFTPPWMISVRGMGHTMGSRRNDPLLDISETSVRFRACHPGERTYQVIMLTNPGDTCVSYNILPPTDASGSDQTTDAPLDLRDEVPFRAWPTSGIIPPHQFHLIVLEFAPLHARNDRFFAANFSLVVDYNENQPKILRVLGRSWTPEIVFCRGQAAVTFPPTSSGITTSLPFEVKNISEIPISYECRIPSRFRNVFWFDQASGELKPSQSTSLVAHFCPGSEKVFSAPMYCVARCIEDKDNLVEGPMRILQGTKSFHSDAESYVLQLVGHGKGPMLSLDPSSLDLGAVRARDEVKIQVMVLNSSNLAVYFTVAAEYVSSDPVPEIGEKALTLAYTERCVAGRCTETLELTFAPTLRGLYEYQVTVTPKGDRGGPVGRSIVLPLRAEVQYPLVQIADLRVEAPTLLPQSMMWTQFQVDGINELYRGEVADVERRFQGAFGIDEKKRLVRRLTPFQLLFGTAAAGTSATTVYLVLSNPSRLDIKFSFQTPKDLNLEDPPYWCDEKALIDEREAHFSWVEEHNVYDIQPRSGSIPPGDFLHIKLTYHHLSIGTHILPVVFNVLDGRSVLLYLKGHSVAQTVGCLSVRSSVVYLQPVPLGVTKGPKQPVEISNSGAVSAAWRVDLRSLKDYNKRNYDFEVLSVFPTEGVLLPQSSSFLHFTFTPLEAKSYLCPVRIEMLKDGRPTEELEFELRCFGHEPKKPSPQVEQIFPATLPIQTYAPVPGCGAALSIEALDFGPCPQRAMVSRMLVLVNYTSEFVLQFRWDARRLFGKDADCRIEPSSGDLSPGSHCIITFRLFSEDALHINGEVACHLHWTHLSLYGQTAQPVFEEDESCKSEFFAFHSDHIHQPIRTGKAYLADGGQPHISVANRLTVSRFRHLMSTAAGQKFLNDNLHRTSVLSSHLNSLSPRRAMQASVMGRGSQQKELTSQHQSSQSSLADLQRGLPGLPSPPSPCPLFVRVKALVADWAVPKERLGDFLVLAQAADPAEADDLNQLPSTEENQDATSVSILQAKPGWQGGGQRSQLSGAIRAWQPSAPSTAAAESSHLAVQEGAQTGPQVLGSALVLDVLEHMIQEVMSEAGFVDLLDQMLCQETPCFVQYEDGAPPGSSLPQDVIQEEEDEAEEEVEPVAVEEETAVAVTPLAAAPEEEAAIPPEVPAGEEPLEAEVPQPAEPVVCESGEEVPASLEEPVKEAPAAKVDFQLPTSAAALAALQSPLLLDFAAPPIPRAMASNAGRPVANSPTSSEMDATAYGLPRSGSYSRPGLLEQEAPELGAADLEAFRLAAGEVLDQTLLDMMEDVVAGRLNWMRPPPKVRYQGSRR